MKTSQLAWGLAALLLLLTTCHTVKQAAPNTARFPASALTTAGRLTAVPSGSWRDSALVQLRQDVPVTWTMADFRKYAFQSRLKFPRTLRGPQLGTIQIRAFKHSFGCARLDSVWVLGYVAEADRAHPTLPGPVVEAQVGIPTTVTWENCLAQTLWHNPRYPFPGKWYPLVYDPHDSVHQNTMLREMLYPDTSQWAVRPPMEHSLKHGSGHGSGQDAGGHAAIESASYYATTVHLHGANLSWHYDGYPTAQYLVAPHHFLPIDFGLFGPFEVPKAVTYHYPNTFPEGRKDSLNLRAGLLAAAQMSPSAGRQGGHGGILWYHDHAMMRTATNVYLGLAGAYVIKGGEEERDAPAWLRAGPDSTLLIADKSFSRSPTGQVHLYYDVTQHGPKDEDGQPEFYGNTITVNGTIWPIMPVPPSVHRFRVLNASSSRFYRLVLQKGTGAIRGAASTIPEGSFIQIGTEGGIMAPFTRVEGQQAQAKASTSKGPSLPLPFPNISYEHPLILAPGERADVLINFSAFTPGDSLTLVNYAVNGPYQDDVSVDTLNSPANYLMAFRVKTGGSKAMAGRLNSSAFARGLLQWSQGPNYALATTNLDVAQALRSPGFTTMLKASLSPAGAPLRGNKRLVNALAARLHDPAMQTATLDTLSLVEAAHYADLPASYRRFVRVHRLDSVHMAFPMVLMNGGDWNSEAHTSAGGPEAVRQVENLQTQIWEIRNRTGDTHPIHLHLNRFRVLGRQRLDTTGTATPYFYGATPNELGWKDVVRATTGFKTFIQVQYVLNEAEIKADTGQFVYHCHILEHEDMSMMRRLVVRPTPVLAVERPPRPSFTPPKSPRLKPRQQARKTR